MRKKKVKSKTERIGIRISPKALETINSRAEIAKKSRSAFMIDCSLNKPIILIDFPEGKEIARRLTELSSAVNKTNILAHQDKIQTVYMDKFVEELKIVWQLLSEIKQKKIIKEV